MPGHSALQIRSVTGDYTTFQITDMPLSSAAAAASAQLYFVVVSDSGSPYVIYLIRIQLFGAERLSARE